MFQKGINLYKYGTEETNLMQSVRGCFKKKTFKVWRINYNVIIQIARGTYILDPWKVLRYKKLGKSGELREASKIQHK
jgi:hypothetical protein